MRIKCPFEPFENAPDYNLEELIWHFDQTHECHPPIIGQYYAQLLFKIHGKMNELANTGLQHQFQIASFNTLKSLLNGDIGQ